MKTNTTDILISGGGIAGLTAACAFGSAGISVVCVDPSPPVTEELAKGADIRTTAFLQPAQRLLEQAGLWERLAPHAAALQIMRIVDAGGDSFTARDVADFDASDISGSPFGWNLPNWLLRREILARIDDLPNVTFLPGTATKHVSTRETEARVKMSNGTQINARLLIAADGRSSPVRNELGIGVTTWRYGQKALVFSVTHPKPHNNISTEIHRTGGPFTLVPLPDKDGQNHSAVVWMEKGAEIQKLNDLSETDFNSRICERSTEILGPLKLASKRAMWPIITQFADRLTAQRTALIAEAAHVVPPIGAQGLNMSLNDMICLLELAKANPLQLGEARMLANYQKRRWADVKARATGIDMLNRVSMANNPLLRDIRRYGLKTLHGVSPIRKTLMRTGLGAT